MERGQRGEPRKTRSIQRGFFEWLGPAMFVVILLALWVQLRGYIVLGVTEATFREAMAAAARSLGYTVDEQLSSVTIRETGHRIHITLQDSSGFAQFRGSGAGSSEMIQRLAAGMREHFLTTPGKMNRLTAWLYLAGGTMLLASSMGLLLPGV